MEVVNFFAMNTALLLRWEVQVAIGVFYLMMAVNFILPILMTIMLKVGCCRIKHVIVMMKVLRWTMVFVTLESCALLFGTIYDLTRFQKESSVVFFNSFVWLVGAVELCVIVLNASIFAFNWRSFIGKGRRRPNKVGSSSLQETLEAIQKIIPSISGLTHFEELMALEPVEEQLKESFSDTTFQLLFMGSHAERYGLPRNQRWSPEADSFDNHALVSDCDVMLCPENVSAGYNTDSDLRITHDPSLRADFVKIFQNKGNVPEIFANSFNLSSHKRRLKELPDLKAKNQCLNAIRIKDDVYKCLGLIQLRKFAQLNIFSPKINIVTLSQHGPTVTLQLSSAYGYSPLLIMQDASNYVTFMIDFTFSIKCVWPRISDWQSRVRRWPEQQDVMNIV